MHVNFLFSTAQKLSEAVSRDKQVIQNVKLHNKYNF
jgi:hypothetical protein